MQYTWNDIEQHISQCTQCPLSQSRHLPVMGRGDHQADIMLIAEAPGGQEDQQGIPFVGRSGEILDSLLRDCGLTREEIYITNIVKCHPPGNRDPKDEEKEACFPYLKYETYLLKPKIIVCLGRVAAQRIISADFRITRQHGTWIYRKNCALTATYHPSAILRDPSKYEMVKEDFYEIVKKKTEWLDCLFLNWAFMIVFYILLHCQNHSLQIAVFSHSTGRKKLWKAVGMQCFADCAA